ncbi:hypothetical protein ACNOIU_13040 [Exiguobacterium mexicanum]|uniref:Uncharacterized protein n=1 Tax=Exiguobacterium mexicanum TaxID=340146 RepID=A0ABT7MT76_9BACL|nr:MULTISPECIES: hypothetical protein [Exiguobacterium]MDL5378409.1 hypothetical protein [Exiguobacterium mexicanum]
MSKLSNLLARDYVKPHIYFTTKNSPTIDALFTTSDRNQFRGLENLTTLLQDSKGVIINAFHIDYYQTLPTLIARVLNETYSSKKIWVIGPELSLTILKRSMKNIYPFKSSVGYLNVDQCENDLIETCVEKLDDGDLLYVLPEVSFGWKPGVEEDYSTQEEQPLCSAILSQKSKCPVLPISNSEIDEMIEIHNPVYSSDYKGSIFESAILQSRQVLTALKLNQSHLE